MSVAGAFQWSLRRERAESWRLAWSFGASLAFHLGLVLLWLLITTGQRLHWWDNLPPWLRQNKVVAQLLKPPTPAITASPQEAPLMYVDVSELQATPEPPKNAQFYSSKNAKAANPDTEKETDVPKISGTQTHIVRTEDVPREKFVPLQPAPVAQPAQEEQPEVKARPAQAPGDLALAKPDPTPHKEEGTAPRPRPRTVREARARQPENRLAGQKMRQEGGVARRHLVPSFDTKATPFGVYDSMFIKAVEEHWFSLLDTWRENASANRGKVVLNFVLHYDGTITEMTVSENTAGEVLGLICQRAVLDPAPFEKWPSEMRHQAGDRRPIQFTFFYD